MTALALCGCRDTIAPRAVTGVGASYDAPLAQPNWLYWPLDLAGVESTGPYESLAPVSSIFDHYNVEFRKDLDAGSLAPQYVTGPRSHVDLEGVWSVGGLRASMLDQSSQPPCGKIDGAVNPVEFLRDLAINYEIPDCGNGGGTLSYDNHAGIDIKVGFGTTIYAPADGWISYDDKPDRLYNQLKPNHDLHAITICQEWDDKKRECAATAWRVRLLHLSSWLDKKKLVRQPSMAGGAATEACDICRPQGYHVSHGEPIGYSGNYYQTFGGVPSHLHLEVLDPIGVPRDPYGWRSEIPDPMGPYGNPPLWAAAPATNHGIWATNASMPTARYSLGVAVAGGVLYALGGSDGSQIGPVEAYNPATDSWTSRTRVPVPGSHGYGVVNGIIYAVGDNPSGAVQAYDPATDLWTFQAPIPTRRSALGVGVINGILYAVGGENISGKLTTVEAYNPATDTWTIKASMPTARASFGVAVVGGLLYAIGGTNLGNNCPNALSSVDAYDPATDTWSSRAAMPVGRCAVAAVALNGLIYAVGGQNADCPPLSGTLGVYSPTTNTWSSQAAMPTPRINVGAGVLNGQIYAVGGYTTSSCSNGTFLSTVESFRP
jgi:hypothetical protein